MKLVASVSPTFCLKKAPNIVLCICSLNENVNFRNIRTANSNNSEQIIVLLNAFANRVSEFFKRSINVVGASRSFETQEHIN